MSFISDTDFPSVVYREMRIEAARRDTSIKQLIRDVLTDAARTWEGSKLGTAKPGSGLDKKTQQ